MIHSTASSSDGTSYIAFIMTDSMIARIPLAPVPLSIALSAIARIAPSSKVSFTPSNSNSFLYCLVIAFFGWTRMRSRASSSRRSRPTFTGRRPINSGIRPNLTKSSGRTCLKSSPTFSSCLSAISELNPMDFCPIREPMILSRPSKAPPQINNMLVVSS